MKCFVLLDDGVQLSALRLEVALPRVDPLGLRAADLSAGASRDEDDRRRLRPGLTCGERRFVPSQIHEQRAAWWREGGFHHAAKRAGGDTDDGVRQVPRVSSCGTERQDRAQPQRCSTSRGGLLAAARSHRALHSAVFARHKKNASLITALASCNALAALLAPYASCRSLACSKATSAVLLL